MKNKIKTLAAALLILSGTFSFSQKPKAIKEALADLPKDRVVQEITRLSGLSGGVVGLSAIHVETGKRISQNEQGYFPMASSYKIPIAIELLNKVDSGKLTLDQLIPIETSDLHPGSGLMSERFTWPGNKKPPLALSVRSLLELMLLISDNSATDVCLRLAGGPSAVNACMKRLGIQGLRVDRPTSLLIADWLGVPMDPSVAWSNARFDSLAKKLLPEQEKVNSKKFDGDLKDTSTPIAMSELLLKLYTQPILKADSKTLLLDIMRRCETGLTRIKGVLPPATEVMHKTGTIGMTTNDVGIITLPNGGGHVVLSVFVKSSEKEIPERERAIAEVSRAVYDYFLFNR
jgi:beta-lactamase class A